MLYVGKVSVAIDGNILATSEVNNEAEYLRTVAYMMEKYCHVNYQIISDLQSWAMPDVK